MLWGVSFDSAVSPLQTALADASGPDVDVENALLMTAANSAILSGGAIGGAVLNVSGAQAFPVVALVVIVTWEKDSGPGPEANYESVRLGTAVRHRPYETVS